MAVGLTAAVAEGRAAEGVGGIDVTGDSVASVPLPVGTGTSVAGGVSRSSVTFKLSIRKEFPLLKKAKEPVTGTSACSAVSTVSPALFVSYLRGSGLRQRHRA